jgi:hypothetical protein
MPVATYTRVAQTITAVQYVGGEENEREIASFTQPSIVRYQQDGSLTVSRQDGTAVMHPTDWVLKDQAAVFSFMDNSEFRDTYVLGTP